MKDEKTRLMTITLAICFCVIASAASTAMAQLPFYMFGFPNRELGMADIDTADGVITVSNIGPSGADGIEFTLGEAEFGTARYAEDPHSTEIANFRKTTAYGAVDGVPGQMLGFLLEISDGDTIKHKCVLGLSTEDDYNIEYNLEVHGECHSYDSHDIHVFEDIDTAGITVKVLRSEGGVSVTPFREGDVTESLDTTLIWYCIDVVFEVPRTIVVPGYSPVSGKRIVFKAGVDYEGLIPVYRKKKVAITAKSISPIAITGEAIGMFTNSHIALGQAHILGQQGNDLKVSDIGSSGDDGFRIDYRKCNKRKTTLHMGFEPPSMVPGSSIEVEGIGCVDGAVLQPLGSSRCDKKATKFEITVMRAASDTHTVELWNDDQLMLEVTGHTGVSATMLQTPTCALADTSGFYWAWDDSILITVPDFMPVYATKVLLKPESDLPPTEYCEMLKVFLTDLASPLIVHEEEPPPGTFVRGDADGSGSIDIDDVTLLIGYVFSGGPAPNPLEAGDADCSGGIDIDDVVELINYIFVGGPAPSCDGSPAKLSAGHADLILSAGQDELDSRMSLAIESDFDVQAAQFEFEVPEGMSDIKVESKLEGVNLFHGISGDRLKVGLVDLTGQTMIPADGSEILSVTYGGPANMELTDQIVVARGGGHVTCAVKHSESDAAVPGSYSLEQSKPNPFNPSTEISFSLPTASHVTLVVYNVLGRKVKTLVDQDLAAGNHSVIWDGRSDSGEISSSGVYFYRMESGTFCETKKMVMLK